MLVVQKFGGSSVADAERVFNVARVVTDKYSEGNDVIVVVSAQGDTTDELIEKAIRAHNQLRLPDGMNEREVMFCNILRDADKIDILRVNTEFSIAEIYNVREEELLDASITDEVYRQFYEEHAILRSLKTSPVDHIVGHLSMIFELVYPISVQILKEHGYLKKIFEFHSSNPVTQERFLQMRHKMEKLGYL